MQRWTNLLVLLFVATYAVYAQGKEDEGARYSREATAAMQAQEPASRPPRHYGSVANTRNNIARLADGRPLLNVVDKQKGY